MDKISLNLLKKFYKTSELSNDEIDHITNCKTDNNYTNKYFYYLRINKLVKELYIGKDDNGYPISKGSATITLDGKAFIENLRKENRDKWYPRIISTLALIVSVLALIKSYYPNFLK
jgi:hypothetical protein